MYNYKVSAVRVFRKLMLAAKYQRKFSLINIYEDAVAKMPQKCRINADKNNGEMHDIFCHAQKARQKGLIEGL